MAKYQYRGSSIPENATGKSTAQLMIAGQKIGIYQIAMPAGYKTTPTDPQIFIAHDGGPSASANKASGVDPQRNITDQFEGLLAGCTPSIAAPVALRYARYVAAKLRVAYWMPVFLACGPILAQSGSTSGYSRLRASQTIKPQSTAPPSSLVFVAITPCRVIDTRSSQNFASPFGAPRIVGGGFSLTGGPTRTFPIPASTNCAIPSNAMAYSFNVTVIPPGPLGFLVIWPTGQPRPNAVTVDDVQGQILNDAAIVPAGTNGGVDVFASQDTDLAIDINGYYIPAAAAPTSSLLFVPITPCRVIDTRASQNFASPFGAPSLVGGGFTLTGGPTRTFPISASTTCSIPSNAMAYSFNVTVIPPGPLGFLVIWPTGQPRPNAVTIDDVQGQILNNAAIVPAGTNGSVDIFASQATDVAIDINGYYLPGPATTDSLVFVATTPCRVVDTRTSQNFPTPFGAPSLVGGGFVLTGGPARTFPIPSSTSCSIPSNALAYSFNVTLIPPGPLGFLVIWPTGQPRPNAVTLDDTQGLILNGATFVPAGTNGAIDVFASQTTDLTIDINGYYVPAIPGSSIASVSPNIGRQGQSSLSVILTGQSTHWIQGTTTVDFGAGITAGVTVNSATSAMALLNISPSAALGARNVTVTTGTEVVTRSNGFTVTGAGASSVSYAYDSQGRIASATYTSSSGSVMVTYNYDAAGNRTSVVTQ